MAEARWTGWAQWLKELKVPPKLFETTRFGRCQGRALYYLKDSNMLKTSEMACVHMQTDQALWIPMGWYPLLLSMNKTSYPVYLPSWALPGSCPWLQWTKSSPSRRRLELRSRATRIVVDFAGMAALLYAQLPCGAEVFFCEISWHRH